MFIWLSADKQYRWFPIFVAIAKREKQLKTIFSLMNKDYLPMSAAFAQSYRTNTSAHVDHIRFNAFDMNCAVHQSPGLWCHPLDRASTYNTIDYWVNIAQTVEKGFFDALFIADVLGLYDAYGASADAALRHGAQIPVNDPLLLVSAMAYATKHLGFGITAGTSFEHPFPFARRLSTLDHLTQGRIGWNVVTGYLPSAAKNMGESGLHNHDERYDQADEYLDVLFKLWEGSWEEDAVVRDTVAGIYVNPQKVHPINHYGQYYTVPGIHVSEPSVQRSPVIFQAGASGRGTRFAARNAEAIFTSGHAKRFIANYINRLEAELFKQGRTLADVRTFALVTIITGETDAQAWEKYEDYKKYASIEGALVLLSGWLGIDLSQYSLDAPIGQVHSNAIQSAVKAFQEGADDGSEWTVRDIAQRAAIGGLGPVFIGSGATIAHQLITWAGETRVDGFNVAYAITPGSFEDVVKYVVPQLQERGLYPSAYEEGSLRNRLLGKGDRLAENHYGAQFRFTKV